MSVSFRVGSFTVTAELLSRAKRPFLPPIHKSGSHPTYANKSDCRASSSECGDTAQILSAEEKNNAGIAVQVAEV